MLIAGVVLVLAIFHTSLPPCHPYITIHFVEMIFSTCDKCVAEDTCNSLMTISNTDQFVFPRGYQHLQRPWVHNPTATAATSAAVSQGIHSLLHLEVDGLDHEERVVDIILNLQQNDCFSFLIGDSVRDQFLGELTTNIIDLESNCDSDEIYHICFDKWGSSKCAQIGERNIVHIGNFKALNTDTDIIDSDSWNNTFFGDGISLQYTTNSIAYFSDKLNIVVDITGHGISDTCNKIIHIPVEAEYWEQWVSPEKLFSFWKLRAMGYRPLDADTMSYVTLKIKQFVTEVPEHFQKFYCTAVLGGMLNKSHCLIPNSLCSEVMRKKQKFDDVFKIDLDVFWSDTVKALVPGLECGSCSSFTRGDVCSAVVENGANYMLFLFFAIGGITYFLVG